MVLRAVIEGGGSTLTLTAALPHVTPASGAPLYGPGGYWDARTPAWDTPATTTVTSTGALQNAITDLRTRSGPTAIYLASGSYGGTLGQVSGMASRAQNILIRPANPDGSNAGFTVSCDSLSIAGLIGGPFWQNTTNGRLLRHTVTRNSQITINGCQNFKLIEVVAKYRGISGGDRMHIAGNKGVSQPTKDVTILGCRLNGVARTEGSDGHVDNFQLLQMSGTMRVLNTLFEGGGPSSTLLMKLDFQGSLPAPTYIFDTVWLARGENSTNTLYIEGRVGEKVTLSHVRCGGKFRFAHANYTATMNDVITESMGGYSGSGVTLGDIGPTPPWQNPSWWSSTRESGAS